MKKKYEPSKYRQQLLSDETVKFFWSDTEKLIHYKTCGIARKIPDDTLNSSGEYDASIPQCPECAIRAYIEAFAEDPWNYKRYKKQFKSMGIKSKTLKRMCLEFEMSLKYFSDGIVLIRNGEYWKIQKAGSKKGFVRLLHNNYYFKDGQKIRTCGFHNQIRNGKSLDIQSAINMIARYDYSKHCINRTYWHPKAATLYIRPAAKKTFWGRLYVWFGCRFNFLTDNYKK